MSPKADAYEIVTNRIIEALEQGIVPWHRPWRSVDGLGPTSLQTGRPYRGINVWTLAVTAALNGYTSPYWLTFKQAQARGGFVRKGEKGTQIVLWRPSKREELVNGKKVEKKFLLLRYFTVFNAEQCDDISVPEIEPLPEVDPIDSCEQIVAGYNEVPVRTGGDRACYSPALDYIQMPPVGAFDNAESYYGTLFHELAHSTGHESRLNRPTLVEYAPFGTPSYSKEELVAEFASAFLCGEAQIPVPVEQSAAYIASWLKKLKDDRKMLVSAAAQAQKAADRILGVEQTTQEETPVAVAVAA